MLNHAAIIALCTDFATLAKLTNVGSLFVVVMVAGVTIWRRYAPPINSEQNTLKAFIGPFVRLTCLVAFSIGASCLTLTHDVSLKASLPACMTENVSVLLNSIVSAGLTRYSFGVLFVACTNKLDLLGQCQ